MQQFAGINTVMYYGPTLLGKAGVGSNSEEDKLLFAVPLAAINAFGTLITVFIIDRLGRRYILLRWMPFVAASVFSLCIGLSLFYWNQDESNKVVGTVLSFVSICSYLLFFSSGMASTPWTINAEIYPLHLRGAGISAATFTNWLSNFVVAENFLTVTET